MERDERQLSAERTGDSARRGRRSSAGRSQPRRRTRLARGPLTIGEPAPAVEVRLASAEPYRPDVIADGGSVFGLSIRAASVRGLSKRYLGSPRQDDLCLVLHQPTRTLIVAVADGVSNAPRSHLGAALAVRHATAGVARQLDDGSEELDWEAVFAQAAWALVEEHRRESGDAQAGIEAAGAALATTLLVAAVTVPGAPGSEQVDSEVDGAGDGAEQRREPVIVRLAATGDSPALVLEGGQFDAAMGDPEERDGLLGGGVPSLPRTTRPAETATRTLEPGSALLLCTDGLALPLAGGTGEVGRTFARELRKPPDTVDFARLLDFSRSTYDDDRTLVAIWRQE